MQHETGRRGELRRRQRHIPVDAGPRDHVFGAKLLHQRPAELAAGARYEDGCVSRSDRIGDCVLQSSRTRGSSHGNPCSSGSEGSYSSLTWYSISTSVSASKPCARLPGTYTAAKLS